MLVPIKNYTLTPLKIIPSRTFTNFAFAVGLFTELKSVLGITNYNKFLCKPAENH